MVLINEVTRRITIFFTTVFLVNTIVTFLTYNDVGLKFLILKIFRRVCTNTKIEPNTLTGCKRFAYWLILLSQPYKNRGTILAIVIESLNVKSKWENL